MNDLPGLFDGLIGVLTFQVFVTPAVLVVVYYLGALLGPWLTWWVVVRLRHDPMGASAVAANAQSAEALRVPPYLVGWRRWLVGVVILLVLELGWRMLFELLIAFFDMHDALIAIRNHP
ncbi:MAG: DUF4282 domain-containing protein [Gammaproteobacteria bacterium]|nr:DUF4282 domain-containing protein [Gammaproteobacteria bacterium]